MKILVIDDLRVPNHDLFTINDVDIARTSTEAFNFLKDNDYDAVFWDHDLGGDDTTRPVDLWLEEEGFNDRRKEIATCYIHTANGVGANWLISTLTSRFSNYHTIRVDALEYFTA